MQDTQTVEIEINEAIGKIDTAIERFVDRRDHGDERGMAAAVGEMRGKLLNCQMLVGNYSTDGILSHSMVKRIHNEMRARRDRIEELAPGQNGTPAQTPALALP